MHPRGSVSRVADGGAVVPGGSTSGRPSQQPKIAAMRYVPSGTASGIPPRCGDHGGSRSTAGGAVTGSRRRDWPNVTRVEARRGETTELAGGVQGAPDRPGRAGHRSSGPARVRGSRQPDPRTAATRHAVTPAANPMRRPLLPLASPSGRPRTLAESSETSSSGACGQRCAELPFQPSLVSPSHDSSSLPDSSPSTAPGRFPYGEPTASFGFSERALRPRGLCFAFQRLRRGAASADHDCGSRSTAFVKATAAPASSP